MQENNHLKQLQEYQQELQNEKESLKKMKKIIQKQINALDIERLHLESIAKRPAAESPTFIEVNKMHKNDDEENQLDLNVPKIMNDDEEEEEDENL